MGYGPGFIIISECDFYLWSEVFKSTFLVVYTVCGNGSRELALISWREPEGETGLINHSLKSKYLGGFLSGQSLGWHEFRNR